MKSTYKPTAWHKGLTRKDCNPAYWAAKVTNYIKAGKRRLTVVAGLLEQPELASPAGLAEAHEALRLEAHKKYNLRLARKGN